METGEIAGLKRWVDESQKDRWFSIIYEGAGFIVDLNFGYNRYCQTVSGRAATLEAAVNKAFQSYDRFHKERS